MNPMPKTNGKQAAASNNVTELPVSKGPERALMILDSRALDRECLMQSLVAHNVGMEVLAFASVDEWKRDNEIYLPIAAILLNVGGRKIDDVGVADAIKKIAAEFQSTPVIVLADADEPSQILRALDCGARAYIPSSVGIDVCVEAVNLALAGGTFVPASSILAMRQSIDGRGEVGRPMSGMFTPRQAEVVQALKRGKANKIIAYELSLRESTAKVHIRTRMKKLKATNRTEVAYKIDNLFPREASSQRAVGS
jgi:DNA-binding NarL/FixJ family response regulator